MNWMPSAAVTFFIFFKEKGIVQQQQIVWQVAGGAIWLYQINAQYLI